MKMRDFWDREKMHAPQGNLTWILMISGLSIMKRYREAVESPVSTLRLDPPATALRTAASESLLRTLRMEGADLSLIHLAPSAGGLGVFADSDIASSGEVFRCPCGVLLTAQAALDDAIIGEQLRDSRVAHLLDDRWRVILLLMQRRREGSTYAASLPGSELVESLPLHWPEQEQMELLGGTTLLRQARASRLALRSFYDDIVCDILAARWPHTFTAEESEKRPGSFGWDALCWAHAMFWSRAIGLDLPGGRCERT